MGILAKKKNSQINLAGEKVLESKDADLIPDEGDGRIIDYISGQRVKASDEVVDAVQVFSKRLVEDFDYPKELIQTYPQYRVRKRPSDEEKSYPVDIALFTKDSKLEDDLYIIVECKSPDKETGLSQLKLYMDMSSAEIGVWFNGGSHLYLRKVYGKGTRRYDPIPNIPRYGQRIEDIGLYAKKDLKKPSNLKAIFKDIRNHLAGMTTGITRDEALAQEIINILFCKILDEQNTAPEETVQFRAGINEDPERVKSRIETLFEEVKTRSYEEVFDSSDIIKLDLDSLVYVVGELQNYAIMEADRDAIGDAFEVFIGNALKGPEGQFFTPRNVIKMMVEIIDPQPGENVIDPACGSGGFLINSLAHVWQEVDEEGATKGWTEERIIKRKIEVSTKNFRGVDKDAFLAKVCKAYMALVGDGRGGVFCENSLRPFSEWSKIMQDKIEPGKFDIVLTNPPFGKKIVVKGEKILSQFDLCYEWKKDKTSGEYVKGTKLIEKRAPQIIFLERCLQLLRKGGRMGIVLPEAVFGMPTHGYVVSYLKKKTKILGIISMPESLFKTSGKGGTHTKVCVLFLENTPPKDNENYPIFMADAKWCGHDSRGNPTNRELSDGSKILMDDIPSITQKFKEIRGTLK